MSFTSTKESKYKYTILAMTSNVLKKGTSMEKANKELCYMIAARREMISDRDATAMSRIRESPILYVRDLSSERPASM
jgi:hypothetical protein